MNSSTRLFTEKLSQNLHGAQKNTATTYEIRNDRSRPTDQLPQTTKLQWPYFVLVLGTTSCLVCAERRWRRPASRPYTRWRRLTVLLQILCSRTMLTLVCQKCCLGKKAQLTQGLRAMRDSAVIPRWPSAAILDIIEPEIAPFDPPTIKTLA